MPLSDESADEGRPRFELQRDAWGRLVLLEPDGRKHVGVEPVRAFPISDPEHAIALCDPDGREILYLESLENLSSQSRQLLKEELAQREFVPAIARIVSVSSDAAPCDWDVETDRGPTRFTLSNEDDVRLLGPHRALIADSQGLRYQIPDIRALDAASRRSLERFL